MLHVVEEVQRVERLVVVYVFHSKDLHFGSRGVSFEVEDLLSVGDLQCDSFGGRESRSRRLVVADRLVQTRTRLYACFRRR